MKKITFTTFKKKAKTLNVNDQKSIKGGYKVYDSPHTTRSNKWIEIDIRQPAPLTSGKEISGIIQNQGRI